MKIYKNLNEALRDRTKARALKLKISSPNLPLEIFHLTSLEELYLDGDFEELPDELLDLQGLKLLSLNSSRLKGALSLAFQLPALENLKVLQSQLTNLNLPLGHFSSKITSLTFKNSHLKILPDEISEIKSLIEVNLSGNLLKSLPQGFCELRNLRRLNLDSNKFEKFPDHIRSLPRLHHLSFDQNPLSEEERARIEREFHLHL